MRQNTKLTIYKFIAKHNMRRIINVEQSSNLQNFSVYDLTVVFHGYHFGRNDNTSLYFLSWPVRNIPKQYQSILKKLLL